MSKESTILDGAQRGYTRLRSVKMAVVVFETEVFGKPTRSLQTDFAQVTRLEARGSESFPSCTVELVGIKFLMMEEKVVSRLSSSRLS